MISTVIYDKNQAEQKLLISKLRNQTGILSEEKVEYSPVESPENVQDVMKKLGVIDVALVEIVAQQGVDMAKTIRQLQADSAIMIISNRNISPMKYMIPDIRAASLLLRPSEASETEEVMGEFMKSVFDKRKQEDTSCFVLDNNDGKIMLPYSQIYYFEVSEKKIYARLKSKEYGQYGTMEQLEKELPDQFIRCHRSYIVNTDHINKVKISEGMIYLDSDITVPLSRSYKADIKEFMNAVSKK